MNKELTETINQETREVYHQQHVRMVNNKITMERLRNMGKEEFFQLEKGYFVGKKILDAGCGSAVRNTLAFYEFGCRDLTALDIGDEWKDTALKNLNNYEIDSGFVNLVAGNADNLPFDDNIFDLVCLDGVLPHIPTLEQTEVIFKEIARVTKSGGFFFTSYLSQGGSLMDVLDTSVRQYYRENEEFKKLVDNISPQIINKLLDFIVEKMQHHTCEEIDLSQLKVLFDEDLCISIQNTIQCHTRRNLSKEYIEKLLLENGFDKPIRLKRYVERNNIRKFVSPLHYYDENEFAKLFYGNGYIDCITQKIR